MKPKKRPRPSKTKDRLFKGIPVREARASIYVQPSQNDIDKATTESPINCAYARCLKRVLNTPAVFVFRTTAFIQGLDESGKPLMERYKVRKYAREFLVKFDSGAKVPPGGFVFHKPNLSETLAYKQKMTAKHKRSPHKASGKPATERLYNLRDGKGCVHLFGSEDQIKIWAQ